MKRATRIIFPFLLFFFTLNSALAQQENIFKRGEGSFEYNGYAPLKDKPVTVFYYTPSTGDMTKMPVLFSFHGAERSGKIQLNAWKYFAEQYGFIVIAPEFSKTYFSENDYQFGGIFTSKDFKTVNKEEKWTGKIVESLFDYFKADTKSTASTYNMFGHSAGAQFVHRYLMAMPNARVSKAVAANAGSWTFPYPEGIVGADGEAYGWPMSVMGTPFTNQSTLSNFYGKKLFIQLGQLDTDVNDPNLPKNAAATAQGPYRLERGRFFYDECKKLASKAGVKFGFEKAEVADAGHSTLRMVYGRAVPDRKDISNTGENCAFDLLFK